jgi:RNA polymerase sigma factor (sigma-70 family)
MAKYANLVGSIAYNIVGDVHVAGDITQDTFLKVFRNLKNLDDPRRFKGWLCSIVRTTCVDWLRKERVKPTSLEKITDEGLEPEASSWARCSSRPRRSSRSSARRSCTWRMRCRRFISRSSCCGTCGR